MIIWFYVHLHLQKELSCIFVAQFVHEIQTQLFDYGFGEPSLLKNIGNSKMWGFFQNMRLELPLQVWSKSERSIAENAIFRSNSYGMTQMCVLWLVPFWAKNFSVPNQGKLEGFNNFGFSNGNISKYRNSGFLWVTEFKHLIRFLIRP